MELPVSLSMAHAAVCAHCEQPIRQSGVVGSWLLRPCPSRSCRSEHDGAWNLHIRVGDILVCMGISRRLATTLRLHLSASAPPQQLRELITSSGALWRGPIGGDES